MPTHAEGPPKSRKTKNMDGIQQVLRDHLDTTADVITPTVNPLICQAFKCTIRNASVRADASARRTAVLAAVWQHDVSV